MTTSRDDPNIPMAEPGKHPSGANTGGMAKSADGGLADATQRSMERGDDTAAVATPTPAGAPAGTAAPADGRRPAGPHRADDASADDDEGEQWRHAPRPAKDQNPLESLGKSISDAVTGSAPDRSKGPKT